MREKLYQAFSPEIDFSDIKHIVIGSGIGGLTAATWLAKGNEKVIVLERHFKPGGFMHSFKRKNGFQWETGVHYIGNTHKGGSLRQLFDFLTAGKTDWESMGETYDVVQIGNDTYEFKAGKENFRKQLKQYFPEEGDSIDKYLALLDKSNKRANAFFFEKTFKPILQHTVGWFIKKLFNKYASKTTLEVLSEITTNNKLIAVLCAQCGNYGLTPKYSSFAAHAIVIGHFMEGGNYPKGGPDNLCDHAIANLNAHGGAVYVNAEVTEIVTEKNRVKGIMVGDKFIPCTNVISNAGVDTTFNYLVSQSVRKKCGFDLKRVKPSSAHMCLYVGLDQSDESLNLPKHNLWSFEDYHIDNTFDTITMDSAPEAFTYISFPSAKDPTYPKKHPNTATIQALTKADYSWFSEYETTSWMNRGEKYNRLKKEFEKNMLDKLYRLFPQIKGHVVATEVSSPLSTKHFTNYKNGEIYGLEHTPDRFKLSFLRPETKVKGLYLTGQDITLVGVAGAMAAGMLCAITILKFRVWKLFKEMSQMQNH